MIDYIKINCELPPLEKPLYDEDSDTWDVYFEEKGNWHPAVEDSLICLPFESQEEATQIFNQSMRLHDEQLKESKPTAKAS